MRTPFLLAAAFVASSGLTAQAEPMAVAAMQAMPMSAPSPTAEEATARAFRVPQLSGTKLSKAVTRVASELKWQTTLDAAAKLARVEHKPIVWIQALGTLKGFL